VGIFHTELSWFIFHEDLNNFILRGRDNSGLQLESCLTVEFSCTALTIAGYLVRLPGVQVRSLKTRSEIGRAFAPRESSWSCNRMRDGVEA